MPIFVDTTSKHTWMSLTIFLRLEKRNLEQKWGVHTKHCISDGHINMLWDLLSTDLSAWRARLERYVLTDWSSWSYNEFHWSLLVLFFYFPSFCRAMDSLRLVEPLLSRNQRVVTVEQLDRSSHHLSSNLKVLKSLAMTLLVPHLAEKFSSGVLRFSKDTTRTRKRQVKP